MRFTPNKKLKLYGQDIWGTLLRTRRQNNVLKRLIVLYMLAIEKKEEVNTHLTDLGIRYTPNELEKLSGLGGSRRFAHQILRYEYRMFRSFYHSISGYEWSQAWALARKLPGHWIDALLRHIEGRVEYLFFRAGILKSPYVGRSMLKTGFIHCYRGKDRLSSAAPRTRMILRPGDTAHLLFASKNHLWKGITIPGRLDGMHLNDMMIRLPPPYLVIDYEGLSLGLSDQIYLKDIRYPFNLPGVDYTARLRTAIDSQFYSTKKRYRRKDYDDYFARPMKEFDDRVTHYDKITQAPRFKYHDEKPLYVYKYRRQVVESRQYMLPFHEFPQHMIDRDAVIALPKVVKPLPPKDPRVLLKGGLVNQRIVNAGRMLDRTGQFVFSKYIPKHVAQLQKLRLR